MKITKERIYKMKNEPNALVRFVLRKKLFGFFQLFGIHATANHFYEPIPDSKFLAKDYDDQVKAFPHAAAGWKLNEVEEKFGEAYEKFAQEFATEEESMGYGPNHYFGRLDAISLYVFLRVNKVLKVTEVGQGFSTRVMARALRKNSEDLGVAFTAHSIDPFARTESQDGDKFIDGVKIIKKSIQDLGAEKICEMVGDGLLFVDSSHIYKTGSDVQYLQRNVYPILKTGSYLHIHDIYLPFPWPKKNYLEKKWFWNEQDYLLEFLSFNGAFALELPVHWVFRESKVLRDAVEKGKSEDWVEGTSLYLKKVGDS